MFRNKVWPGNIWLYCVFRKHSPDIMLQNNITQKPQQKVLIDRGKDELNTAKELIDSELAKEFNILAEGDDWHKVGDGIFHASKITGCLRRKWFVYLKKEEKGIRGLSPQTARYFKRGRLFDEWLTNSEHFQDKHIQIEIPIDNFVIRAEIDAVSRNYIWEFKTWSRASQYLPKKVENSTLNQVTCYMRALNKDRAKVCYIRPDNLYSRTFTLGFDLARWENIVARVAQLNFCLEQSIPPPITESCWCQYCRCSKSKRDIHISE